MNPTQDFATSLAAFVDIIQKKQDNYFAKNYTDLVSPLMLDDPKGTKYVRIVANDRHKSQITGNVVISENGRRVWCFVEKATGDVFKAASFKVPAKHARGNIYSADPWKGMTVYGPEYLR